MLLAGPDPFCSGPGSRRGNLAIYDDAIYDDIPAK